MTECQSFIGRVIVVRTSHKPNRVNHGCFPAVDHRDIRRQNEISSGEEKLLSFANNSFPSDAWERRRNCELYFLLEIFADVGHVLFPVRKSSGSNGRCKKRFAATSSIRYTGLHPLYHHTCSAQKDNNIYCQIIARIYITHCIQISISIFHDISWR